jgi:large subunit ribosomal protein L30
VASSCMTNALIVTLRRGTAGKPATLKRVLDSLGLRRPRDASVLPNDGGTRGKISRVAHLVRVETEEEVVAKAKDLADKRAVRTPIVVKH